MNRFRLACAALVAWFAVFLNVERLFAPMNLASFVYVFAAGMSLLIILAAPLQCVSPGWLFALPVPVIVAIKRALGYSLTGIGFSLTVTEICAVEITIAVSWWISRSLEDVRGAVADMLLGEVHHRSVSFDDGQRQMYREVRRARIYERCLTLLAVSASSQSAQQSVDRIVKELQVEAAQRRMLAKLAGLLSTHTKTCDIIAQRGGHFLVLLPEIDRPRAQRLIDNLTAAAQQSLGLELRTGVALFPEEEATFVKLLERAEASMAEGKVAAAPKPAPVDACGYVQPDLVAQPTFEVLPGATST